LDRDLPWLGNELNAHKLPILKTDENGTPTVWQTDHFDVVAGSRMEIKVGSYSNWESTQVVYSITAVVAIKLKIMTTSDFSNMFRFKSRKTIGLGVTNTGELVATYIDSG
jgi:hypothetical protein